MRVRYEVGESIQKRSAKRARVPLLLIATAIVAAGCMASTNANQGGTATDRATPSADATSTATAQPLASLGQDDPKLGMPALAGQSLLNVLASSVQVLPNGNVSTDPSTSSAHLSPTTTTQWLQSTVATSLWSGPDADASAFTDVPVGSYFRVTGPMTENRVQVYYVGDGLMRMPGTGWVDSGSVQLVEAPPPGQVAAIDVDARAPLPVWVQAHKATTLWSGPDGNAVTLTDLPQWTFLKVAGVERNGRLLVNYAGDYASRQPGIGWVDQASVGPAGDPGVWVTNHRATALWSGVDANAVKFTDLPQWSKLRIVPGAPSDSNRLEVQFFGDGFTREPGVAWITLADVGPITPPVPLPSLPSQQVQHQTFASDTDFINSVGAAAQSSARTTGVPASVTVAQAILESDWGRSRLTRQGNNLFGIKALSGPGPDGVVTLATWEHTPDGDVLVQAPFRAYATLQQSIDDHGKFFIVNHRYAAALAVGKDARAFAQAIQDAGYATDPNYADKLIALMDKYNLYRFDN